MTEKEILDWLNNWRHFLKITVIGRAAGIPPATITRAVKGENDAEGYPISLPADKLPRLAAIIEKMRA